ncbi:prepilin-type N-terminal cleavage/methylation domain-containing protein [Desulfobacula phenolica]|uniref:Type IV pilin N-term methylation site GFxxxE n=1 Tax=Desulfobacula phenolica TaxID=90732 RepID=A0A1H2FST0_9BACT|nr:prepilin-type N-terminal cleavage/methylation domain-containing protein [Desulfobacula phenolica]SDU10392.1 Type IV pilin N-term methylation site GFxxxE [Desulfobacula phenolica]
MEKRNIIRNQKGFTLIEIIAVLVILGILAAVAVPKYLDLQTDAKAKAAVGQVAEMKGTLSIAWGKAMLNNGGTATITQVMTASGLGATQTIGTAPDIWTVTTSVAGNVVTIGVADRNGDTEYAASGTWTLP